MNIEFDIKVPRSFTINITNRYRAYAKEALDDIRYQWKILFLKQINTLQGVWHPLTEAYKKQKLKDYSEGKIKYNRILRRNGDLLTTYMRGVRVVPAESAVEIPYGTKYAPYHQFGTRKMEKREFNLDEFESIAIDIFRKKLKG